MDHLPKYISLPGHLPQGIYYILQELLFTILLQTITFAIGGEMTEVLDIVSCGVGTHQYQKLKLGGAAEVRNM